MLKKVLMTAVAVAALLTVTTAMAGTVFLPSAMNQTIEGVQYRSIIWITNTGEGPTRVNLRYIPMGTDGAAALEAEEVEYDESVVVQPASTVVLTAAYGPQGMLEVTSEGKIHAVSELNAFSASGQKLTSASVPLIGADRTLGGGETAELMALERQIGASQTNVGINNLDFEANECRIRVYDSLGEQLAGTAIVTVPPLGQLEFYDAFGILGEPSIDGARIAVTCEAPFYAYATLLSRVPFAVHFIAPAAGGDLALAGPPASGTLLERNGQFFAPRQGDSLLNLPLPLEPGVDYESVTVEVDMFVATLPTTLFTSTLQLRRRGPGGLFWAHTIRGGGRQKTLLDMGVGDALVHQGPNGTWFERSNYRLVVHYDVNVGQIDWQVFRNNQLVEQLVRPIGRFDLRHDGQGVDLIFGLDKVYDNAFFPPWGFRFSNLRVSAVASTQ